MAAPKIRPSDFAKLYQEVDKTKTLQEKKTVESLIERLNGKIQKDPILQKKAALIIEEWLKKTRP